MSRKVINFDSLLKLLLKSVIVAGLAYYVAARLHIDAALVLPLLFLILIFMLVKRYFPFAFRFIKRLAKWLLKVALSALKWLWRKPERKGGAQIRQSRMRWRL